MTLANTEQRRTIPSLTGIRGVAAAWVLLFHLQEVYGTVPGFAWLKGLPILATGWSGVDLFFVLSGFVLMRAHGEEFARLGLSPTLRFAKVRFARVYPVSAVVLLLIVLLTADHGFVAWYRTVHVGNLTRRSFVETLLLATRWFLPGPHGNWNQPTWSLSAEIVGYAAFPLIALLLVRRSWSAALMVALTCIGALLIYQAAAHVDLDDFDQRTAIMRMGCCFIAGAALARAVALAPQGIAGKSAMLANLAALLILAACLIPAIRITLPCAYAVLVFSLAFRRGRIDRALSAPFTQFLGKISFPLYLVHVMPLLWLTYRLRNTQASVLVGTVAILLYVVLVIGAATLLHFSIERSSHRWGRRWAQRPAIDATGALSRAS